MDELDLLTFENELHISGIEGILDIADTAIQPQQPPPPPERPGFEVITQQHSGAGTNAGTDKDSSKSKSLTRKEQLAKRPFIYVGQSKGKKLLISDIDKITDEQQLKIDSSVFTCHNIMASFKVGCRLDLKSLAINIRGVEFDANNPAARLRLTHPDYTSTLMIFPSGTVLIAGCKTLKQTVDAAALFSAVLKAIGVNTDPEPIRPSSMLFAGCLPFPVDLPSLSTRLVEARYEPEVFPAMNCRCALGNLSLMHTGRFTVTGCRSEEDARHVVGQLYPLICRYRLRGAVEEKPVSERSEEEEEESSSFPVDDEEDETTEEEEDVADEDGDAGDAPAADEDEAGVVSQHVGDTQQGVETLADGGEIPVDVESRADQ
eukprot:gnl/Dysnectes_brevis/4826_a6673_483.p1 GENE.gnl/Dysnectes_brevis/4826_a6673_483~~gnl/Dysnectes_brevis/4826_a6673_483.p1  ORF type:complete len:375 (+),score=85.62 gnl/Dysnectes_brevis/4826_a6673_483:74-1198(+)